MKFIQRLVSFICAISMIFSICTITSFASSVEDNWTAMSAKYSNRAKNIILNKDVSPFTVKTDGFSFTSDRNNGIKVVTPEYNEFAGVYPVTAVTSKNKTMLDGASVTVMPDDIVMTRDVYEASPCFSVVFSDTPVNGFVYDWDNIDGKYCGGLNQLGEVATGGLRNAVPEGTRALIITVNNGFAEYDHGLSEFDGKQMASSVSITYYDGEYINADQRKGFRWTFTARNYLAESPNADSSPIYQRFERIDISNGLTVSLKADENHGYIVNINGKDYYKGTNVAYFPDCSTDRFYKKDDSGSYLLYNDDYTQKTEKFLKSMTYARSDIDLRQFAEFVKEAYVTVGVNGNAVNSNPCNYTITRINSYPAATWKGESACDHSNVSDWTETKAATCGADGTRVKTCLDCGIVVETETIPATGNHTPGEYKVTLEPTCNKEGKEIQMCTVCGNTLDTRNIPVDENAHAKEWEITREPTCTAEGEKQEVCTACGEVFATETVEKAEHTPAKEWKVTEAEHPYLEEGKRELLCTVCGEVLKTEVIPVKEYVKPTDVVAAWYESQVEYCVKHGLMTGMSGTEFGVNSTLTREQFILILARLANVDENAYKGGDIGFGDVPADHWGAWAIKWAHDEKITAGVGNGNFGVEQSLVREQFAVLIYSYMEKVGKDIKIDDEAIANFRKYEDINNVSSWAVDGVTWAMSKGIIGSMVTGRFVFSPKSNVTRAQAAVMIRNIHSDGLFE